MNKIVDIMDQFPWLGPLPPSVCWAWVRLMCYVHKHGRPAGHIPMPTTSAQSQSLEVSHNDYCMMIRAAVKANDVMKLPGKDNDWIICCLDHPAALAPSTLRTRKYRSKKSKKKPTIVTYAKKDAQDLRTALKARGLATPSGFAGALMVGMNLMAMNGKKQVPTAIMRHWLHQKGVVPPCSITWLNHFVSSVIGLEVNLTQGLRSRYTKRTSKPSS